jgi:putative FmdB family regulatory protein
MLLKDFECSSCGNTFEDFVVGDDGVVCPRCGQPSRSVIHLSAPVVTGCDSFNPHYDIQLGQHFATREERTKFLQKEGKVSHGPDSPRKATKLRPLCTREQASQWEKGKTKLGDGK